MSRDKRDKEFYHMLDHVEELPADLAEHWYGFDSFRKEALAAAIAAGKIGFHMRPKYKNYVPPDTLYCKRKHSFGNGLLDVIEFEGNDHTRVEVVKDFILTTPHGWDKSMLNAGDLLAWLNKTYPLESPPDPVSELPFMSDKLAFAVECSEALYPEGYKSTDEKRKVQADRESGRIRDHLEKHKLTDRARKALIVQLNPVSE